MINSVIESDNSKVPRLRFPEFSDEWRKVKLGEIAHFWNGKAHEQDIVKYGHYIVINSKFISTDGNVRKYSDKQISPLKKNDITIVMSDIPNGKAIAKCFLVDQNDKYTLNQRIGGINSDEAISSFLIRVINRNKYFLKIDNGVSQTNLRRDEILDCPLKLPALAEQQKISDFLTLVDTWLNNLRSQKESLEVYKKSVMQKIFSQELRFKDTDGKDFPDWEEKELGDICENGTSNLSAIKLTDNNGQYPIYGASGLFKKVDFFKEKNPYISIVKDGAGVGKVLICDPNSSVLGTLSIIRPKANINLYFLYQLITGLNFEKYTKGSTIPHIYFKDYKKEIMHIPSVVEQQIISDFLMTIDDNIESKKCQINELELWKKGLMQQMFV